MAVLVVGSVALDAVTTPAGRADGVVGGSAVFFSAAASLLTDVRVVAVAGDDYPVAELEFIRRRGADFSGLVRSAGESFFWAGRYSGDFRERETVETRLGVFGDFRPRVPDAHRDCDTVFLGNVDPALQLDVLRQVRSPALVAADTMDYWIERSPRELDAVLARVDALLVNEEEARQLAREDDLERAAAAIRARGPDVVVVKRGEKGAVLFAAEGSLESAAAPPARLVDPTGAGDAFAGGLLGHLDRTDPGRAECWDRALRYGAAMGSYAVEAFSVDRFRELDGEGVEDRVDALVGRAAPALEGAGIRTTEGAP